MAIQIPNPGTGNGATGDNEFVLWTKVKDNFSNTAHAASRLVGTGTGQVPVFTGTNGLDGINGTGLGASMPVIMGFNFGTNTVEGKPRGLGSGFYYIVKDGATNSAYLEAENTFALIASFSPTSKLGWRLMQKPYNNKWYLQSSASTAEGPWQKPCEIYHTGNTQSDTSTNGYIKPSSPIIMLHSDSITTNDDGEKMGVEFTKKGVGDYEIKGTTGLRNEGWYIEIPNDLHGNPMVAVTLDEKDGTLNLKSFKRVFNMQTFKFEPDLDSPMDIPEGRWIDLRFNDLPQEQLDEPIE